MKKRSGIHWVDYSFNPYTWACTKVSEGCRNCYMFRMASDLGKSVERKPEWREAAMKELTQIPAGSTIFVNTMSDTYHKDAPVEWIARIHDIVIQSPQFIFLLLTKRPERAFNLANTVKWPENLWLGTSVENQDYMSRIEWLLRIPAAHHFISFEPLLGQITMPSWKGVQWIVIGGESGPQHRFMDRRWAQSLYESASHSLVPVFFKQGHGFRPGEKRDLLGGLIEEYPPQFGALKQRYQGDIETEEQLSLF